MIDRRPHGEARDLGTHLGQGLIAKTLKGGHDIGHDLIRTRVDDHVGKAALRRVRAIREDITGGPLADKAAPVHHPLSPFRGHMVLGNEVLNAFYHRPGVRNIGPWGCLHRGGDDAAVGVWHKAFGDKPKPIQGQGKGEAHAPNKKPGMGKARHEAPPIHPVQRPIVRILLTLVGHLEKPDTKKGDHRQGKHPRAHQGEGHHFKKGGGVLPRGRFGHVNG